MKTGIVIIERCSIWCPECNQFAESPLDDTSILDEVDYSRLPQIITCSSCHAQFRRPQVTFSRRPSSRNIDPMELL